MLEAPIPNRIPATANDLATSVMRGMNQHMELGCRLSFAERLDADVLRRAVRLSLDAEPVLGCALQTGFRSGWWERIPDLDERVPFSVLETKDVDSEAARFQSASIPDSGPQVAVRLLRSAERDDVCLRISHNVADGQAMKQYAYLLADLYSRLSEDAAYVPTPNRERRPSAREMWERLSPEARRCALDEPRPTMPNWRLRRRGVTGRGRTLRELRLAPERFIAAREYGKERGATVNELLLTAFFRSVARSFPPPEGPPMSLAFTADHRRYLPRDADLPISNLAISIWMGIPWVADEGSDGTLSRVVEQVSRWRDATWGARGAVRATALVGVGYEPMRALMKAMGRASARSGKTSPVFTNLGVLDEDEVAFGGIVPLEARFSGPAAWGASFVATVGTYRDVLSISMGFCEEDMDAADVEEVLRGMDDEIRAMATVAGMADAAADSDHASGRMAGVTY